MATSPELHHDADAGRLLASGDWTLANLIMVSAPEGAGKVEALDATGIGRMDAAGAQRLLEVLEQFELDDERVELEEAHRPLFDLVRQAARRKTAEPPSPPGTLVLVVEHVGAAIVALGRQLMDLAGFLGLTLVTLARTLIQPRRLRLTSTVFHMEQTGFNAVPLVALLSFLVGAVIAFLGATVLRDFGAELFVVELVSYAFLREFGVLLTAILLAGRTASAFTAQIGTMKSREEIDAMRTLGLDAVELLVIPRLLALLIMLPALAFIAMMAGLAGGLVVAAASLGMPPELYLSRLYETMELRHYLVGLVKAPVFAMIIALVGCLEGFKVAGTAQSVGERTTSAVVQSISLVIVVDAIAAVFFMEIGL